MPSERAGVARLVACRRCGLPSPTSLCANCRSETYGSSEYRINSEIIRRHVHDHMSSGGVVLCVICWQPIDTVLEVTIEHRTSVSCGGSNQLSNLGPAHRRCNYGHYQAA